MSNVLTFGQYAAVEVPVDAYNIRVSGSELRYSDCLTLTFVPFYIPLPEGKWEIVGRLNDLTEQQCHAMGFGPDPNSTTRWSAKDLLRSNIPNPDTNPIILKRL